MKKLLAATFAALLLLSGCRREAPEAGQEALLPGAEEIETVTVTSMPEGYDYSFSGSQAGTLAQYILDMKLQADYPEDPNVYAGMTWVITVAYRTGETVTVYLFGNMFIRAGGGPWYKVDYQQAEAFGALLDSLS